MFLSCFQGVRLTLFDFEGHWAGTAVSILWPVAELNGCNITGPRDAIKSISLHTLGITIEDNGKDDSWAPQWWTVSVKEPCMLLTHYYWWISWVLITTFLSVITSCFSCGSVTHMRHCNSITEITVFTLNSLHGNI